MFLLITTWWFWIVFVEVVCLFGLLAYDRGTWASVSLVAFGAALYFLGDVDFITYFKENPKQLVYGAAVYFPIGALWSIFKWFMLVLDKKTEYKEHKLAWLSSHGLSTLPATVPMNQDSIDKGLFDEKILKNWKDRHKPYGMYRDDGNIPQVRNYKYDILRWVGYWPFNVVWTLISDFVKRISKAIYNMIQGWLQAISNRMFADVKSDL